MDFDKSFWPSAADMNALRQEDDWRRVDEECFSVDNVHKYCARSPPLGLPKVKIEQEGEGRATKFA